MNIEWAPVKIPPRRRLQTLAAGLYVLFTFTLPLMSFPVTAALLYYGGLLCRTLVLVYLCYIFYDHSKRFSAVPGNGWMFARNNFMWRNLRDYFPVELVKTAELTPDRNYIVASFPHGIIGTCVSTNMGTDISKWIELFPGIRPKIGTLDIHFYTPFLRELIRCWGGVSVAKDCLIHYLSKSNDPKHPENKDGFTSNAVAILVGGAQEALDAHPGDYILTLKNRKGFVKLAIETGCPIVPSFSFGEIEIYDQMKNPPESLLYRIQSLVKKVTGISPVVILGRGFFQYSYGFLPRRKHIVQVVGAPIEVQRSADADPKYVDEVHEKVIAAVTDLFNTYKVKYLDDHKNIKLIIH